MDRITRNQRLRDIAKFIEELPEDRLEMSDWFTIDCEFDLTDYMREDGSIEDIQKADPLFRQKVERLECGTSACVAGWACTLFGDKTAWIHDVSEKGQELLGLTHDEAQDLFYTTSEDDEPISKERVVEKIRSLITRA